MKIALSCETTVDLTKDLLQKNDIHTVPFYILLGDDLLEDGEGISAKIFDFVSKTKIMPKTSAVNEEQFREYFTKLLKDYDAIIHISLSSKMSSAYSNAVKIADEIGNDKIKIIDSMSLSTGIALLALYARKLIDNGDELNSIVNKVEKRVPNVQASFIVNRLQYLYKGGRCSSMQYYGASVLQIKPEIVVKDGEMQTSKKFFGFLSNTLKKYYADIMFKFNNPDKENVFITYSTADSKDVESIKQDLLAKGFKNVYTTTAGGTISSHCGPECLGILFINDGAQE